MNKGFGYYYKKSCGSAFRCLYKKRGNIFRYYAYIFMEILSLIFFPIRPITKALNYQIANDANEGRNIALSLGLKNIANGKTYWSTLLAIIMKAFIIIGIVVACLLPAGILFGISYGVYAYIYYQGKNMMLILYIGMVPAALVLLVSLIYIPIRTVPVGFINNKNPNVDASRSVFISFDALKKEGKFTLFLGHLVSIIICVLMVALIALPYILYTAGILKPSMFYLVPILMSTIGAVVLVFLPLFILTAQCFKERLFYDVIQNPKDFKKDLDNIVFKRDRKISTANALVRNFDDVKNQDKLHVEKVKVKVENIEADEDEEVFDEDVSKKDKLKRVKEQKKLQKEFKDREVKEIFDDEPNPEEGKELETIPVEENVEAPVEKMPTEMPVEVEATEVPVETEQAPVENETVEAQEPVEEAPTEVTPVEPEETDTPVETPEEPSQEAEAEPTDESAEAEEAEDDNLDEELDELEDDEEEPAEATPVEPATEPQPEPEAPKEEPEPVKEEAKVEAPAEPETKETEPVEAPEEPKEKPKATTRVTAKKTAAKATEKKATTKSSTTKASAAKTEAKPKATATKTTKASATKETAKPAEKKAATKSATKSTTTKTKSTTAKAKDAKAEEPKKATIKVIRKPKTTTKK